MLTISVLELAEQIASERKATDKEKAELLEKAKIAIEKARKMNWFLSEMTDPEKITRMKILEVMSDRQVRSWSELERETGLSPSTLSRALKAMIKDGWVDRAILSRFPPTSAYAINESIVDTAHFFKGIRNTVAGNFFMEMVREFSDEEILNSARCTLNIVSNNALGLCLQTYKDRGYQVTWDVIFYSTYFLVMQFWGLFVRLAQTKELTDKAIEAFMSEVKQYQEELKMAKKIGENKTK